MTKPKSGDISATLMKALADASTPIPTPSPWQPIATAPKDGTTIITGHFFAAGCLWVRDDQWAVELGQWDGASPTSHNPTHWMPMPPLPNAPTGPEQANTMDDDLPTLAQRIKNLAEDLAIATDELLSRMR